jgi:hypothetical protein
MLATETFIGKLSRGARPGQSVQLHPEAMGRLKRRRTSRSPAKLFVFFQVVSSRR